MCAQCLKANRECIPSSGITFRHQQNPSMNGDPVARESLRNFYGYKETFGPGSTWVTVPRELTFVHTSNPYEDEDGTVATNDSNAIIRQDDGDYGAEDHGNNVQSDFGLSQASFPAYATHGLEALSAVASQDQYNYAPAPAPMSQHETPSHLGMDGPSPQNINAPPTQNLDFILNPSRALSPQSNIDPRLHPQDPTEETPAQQDLSQSQNPEHVRSLLTS